MFLKEHFWASKHPGMGSGFGHQPRSHNTLFNTLPSLFFGSRAVHSPRQQHLKPRCAGQADGPHEVPVNRVMALRKRHPASTLADDRRTPVLVLNSVRRWSSLQGSCPCRPTTPPAGCR